jgi:hypothetical protein
VSIHTHQGYIPKTLSNSQLLLLQNHLIVREQKINPAALDDVNVRWFITFLEHMFALLENCALQPLENFVMLRFRRASQYRNMGKNGTHGLHIHEWRKSVHAGMPQSNGQV